MVLASIHVNSCLFVYMSYVCPARVIFVFVPIIECNALAAEGRRHVDTPNVSLPTQQLDVCVCIPEVKFRGCELHLRGEESVKFRRCELHFGGQESEIQRIQTSPWWKGKCEVQKVPASRCWRSK